MGSGRLRQWSARLLIVLAIVASLAALLLLERSAENSEQFSRYQPWIFFGNLCGVVALAVVLLMKVWQLGRDLRTNVAGSRLTLRIVATFGALVIVPLLIVYLFSLEFLNRGVDSWFEKDIHGGLNDALVLSRSALDLRLREQQRRTQQIAAVLSQPGTQPLQARLDHERAEADALELALFSGGLRPQATSGMLRNTTDALEPELLLKLDQAGVYAALRPEARGQILITTAARLPGKPPGNFVLVLYRVPPELAGLAEAVQTMFLRYGNDSAQRDPLKHSFGMALTLVLLFTMLAAIYVAIFSAQRLMKPVQDLVAGTRAVGKGDLATKLPLPSRDELGYLVHSFNDMTKRLRRAREEAGASQQAAERERGRLAAILANLSSGVLVLDADLKLRSANQAAGSILGVTIPAGTVDLVQLAASEPHFAEFVGELRTRLSAGRREWREQLPLATDTGRRTLYWACSPLPGSGEHGDLVLVFDDISALLTAQRHAAWGEVARRLAHEIKNPLTPIQLSAERLRRNLRAGLNSENAQLLDRATQTIVHQVDAMKQMVNAFSEYARTPDVQFARFDLNQLVAEVTELYRLQDPGVAIRLELESTLPEIEADRLRIRQVMGNLISNAQHAVHGRPGAEVRIGTRLLEARRIEVQVSDNGPGFQGDLIEKAFDPYVTTKVHGTGLGLAIVRRIVDEHGGQIEALNRSDGGARIRVVLPLVAERRNEPRKERA